MFALSTRPTVAFFDVGGTSLVLETRLTATYESYFVGTTDQRPDTYYTLGPTLLFNRNAGLVRMNAEVGMNFTRYEKHTTLDSEDARGTVRVTLPDPKEAGNRLTGSFFASYHEGVEISEQVNDRVYAETLTGGASFEYAMNPQSSIGEGFSYSKSTRNVYSDQTLFSNDLSYIYYGAQPGASARLVYTYNRTFSSGSKVPIPTGDPLEPLAKTPPLDQTAHAASTVVAYPVYGQIIGQANFGYRVLNRSSGETKQGQSSDKGMLYGLSFTGPLLSSEYFPSTQNTFTLSYQESATPGVNDSGGKTLTGALNFGWQPRDTARFSVHANRSLTLGISDQTIENTVVGAGFSTQVMRLVFDTTVDYIWRKYRGVNRQDTQFDYTAGGRLPILDFLDVGASYNYVAIDVPENQITTTGLPLKDYDRHRVSVFLALRF